MIDESLDEVVARLVERIEGRYYGKYRGIVTDNQDPDDLGRLKAQVPRLLGSTVETGWALPCLPYGGLADQGMYFVPDQGATVWMEFEGGDLAYPIWTGTWWGDNELPESAAPAQKVIKTSSGHKVVLDDDGGSIEVTDSNGNTIKMDNSGVTITDQNQNSITMDSSGVAIADSNQNSITMDSSGIVLKGSKVSVGDPASDNLVMFTALDTALQTFASLVAAHMHTGNLGFPTSPPMPPPIQLQITPAKSHHALEP
jgi:uncharacterized protein involved in type VI secretion and phage assembly